MVRMEIHELLDRLELLSNNDNVSDIRRAVIDKDFNSIFRLLEKETNTQLLPAIKKHHNILGDALSQGQIKSKQWLLSKIKGIDLGTVFICAGWYGILATMMFEDKNVYVDKIRSFDIDDSCCNIAEDFNRPWTRDNWKFKALTQNILDINYTEHSWTFWSKKNNRQSYPIIDKPNTIINTSCEHIENFEDWFNLIPKRKLIALQTNNYFELPEHINCVKDINEFKQQAPLNIIIYEGELELEKYIRYMLIGYK